jgi:hypothetical protein
MSASLRSSSQGSCGGAQVWVNANHLRSAFADAIKRLVAGICEFLRAPLQPAKQPGRVFYVLLCPPLCKSFAHGPTKPWSEAKHVREKSVFGAPNVYG